MIVLSNNKNIKERKNNQTPNQRMKRTSNSQPNPKQNNLFLNKYLNHHSLLKKALTKQKFIQEAIQIK